MIDQRDHVIYVELIRFILLFTFSPWQQPESIARVCHFDVESGTFKGKFGTLMWPSGTLMWPSGTLMWPSGTVMLPFYTLFFFFFC